MNVSFRSNFPSLQGKMKNGAPYIFMDGPAGTQVPAQVINAISEYYMYKNANSHGNFITSSLTDDVVQDTRAAMVAFLGANNEREISLGPNMTSLAFSLSKAFSRFFQAGDEVIITQLDHEGNRGPWLALREKGIIVREVKLLQEGRLDYDDFESKINEKTRLVAMGFSSNILGTVNDIKRIRQLSHQYGAWLLIDAVHGAPHFSMDVKALDCDFLLCSGYKFYGPHVGVLYAREGLLNRLQPDRLRTAGQAAPESIETGTPNFAAFAGVTAAINFLESMGSGNSFREKLVWSMENIHQHERDLFIKLFRGLEAMEGVHIWGLPPDITERAPTLSFSILNQKPETFCSYLGENGVFAWNGHFYALRTVEILGLRAYDGVIRMGISAYTTSEEVDSVLEIIKKGLK
jgi:cysteine desulfurase family protein (TIGR01976 family)